MLRARCIAVLSALAMAVPALAADVAVTVTVEEGPVDPVGAEAAVWHALRDQHGVEPMVVDHVATAPAAMAREGVSTLYALDITWRNQVVRLDDGRVAVPPAPDVQVTEHVRHGDTLTPVRAWKAVGAAAVYRDGLAEDALLTIPELALQDAIRVATKDAVPPTWGHDTARLRIPVAVAADASYRSFYGARWRKEAVARLEAASALLAQAGLTLDVVGFETWEGAEAVDDLSGKLAHLGEQPRIVDAELRLAFTLVPGTPAADAALEDVGRAFTPGRDVVVVDQRLAPGHHPSWDVAEEATVVAHEVLHALGVPHDDEPGLIMSAHKTTLVWRMSDRSRALARASAEARLAHWNPTAALLALADAAQRWLPDAPRVRLAYVADNLPVAPRPGSVAPTRASALVNAALARHYLLLADDDGDGAQAELHRSHALAHSQAAIAMAPALETDLSPWIAVSEGAATPDDDVTPTPDPDPGR